MLLTAGCDTPDVQRLNDPNAYVQRANATFADAEVAAQLVRTLELHDGDVSTPIRAAMRANRRVTAPTSHGDSAVVRRTQENAVVFVAVAIDAAGKPTDFICQAASPGKCSTEQLAFVERTVRGWHFDPATIDGQPVACTDSFRVVTDGLTFVHRIRYH